MSEFSPSIEKLIESFEKLPSIGNKTAIRLAFYMLNTKDFTLHQLCDWAWLEGEDGRILRQNQGYPTYSATLVKYADLICDRPIAQAKVSNILSTVTNPFN